MKKYFRFLVIFLVLSCWLPHVASAQVVNMPDPNLAAAVRETLGLVPNVLITELDMLRLRGLDAANRQITDLTGLEQATQLTTLNLSHNRIQDITPLTRLTNLEELYLGNWTEEGGINKIANLTPLSRLTNLKILSLFSANIQNKDLTPLARLTQLVYLGLDYNDINNVSPLSGLINLEFLYLGGNKIADLSPLYALLRQNPDMKIYLEGFAGHTTGVTPLQLPPALQDTEAVPQETTVPAPQETAKAPQDEDTQPEPETSPPSTITAGQITFSELMFATSGGFSSQPQWIELYNNAPIDTEPVNLKGSRLVIEARDSETRHRYSVIRFEDLHIAPNWTVLLVTRKNSRDSGYLSEDRVYNLYDHSNVRSLGLRENAVLPASGFSLKLFAADGTLVDTAGNLDGVKRSKDTPAWELPSGWTEDRARTSLIRRYEKRVALPGTEAISWVSAADVELTVNTYYGRETDVGTPGYRRGGPLPVVLSFFRSERTDAGVIIEWTTESETDNAGFNLLRSRTKEGSFVKVNPTLIQGAGTTAERTNYTWTDTTAKPNVAYYYQIEDVSFSGERQRLATVRMKGYVSASEKLTTTWSQLKIRD